VTPSYLGCGLGGASTGLGPLWRCEMGSTDLRVNPLLCHMVLGHRGRWGRGRSARLPLDVRGHLSPMELMR
jgi:hypothetical protein